MSLYLLRLHEHIAHVLVPLLPLISAVMMERLRGVVPVIDAEFIPPRRMAVEQKLHAAGERGLILVPTQIQPAEQTFGSHHRRWRTVLLIAVLSPILVLNPVEIGVRP